MMFKNSACRSFETQTTNKTAALQVGKDKRQRIIKAQQFLVGGFNPFEKYQLVKTGIFPNFRDDSIKHIWVATQIWLKRQHCDIKNPLVMPLQLEEIFEQFEDVPAGLLF